MWQDDVLQIIEGVDYETVTIRANGEPQEIRVYPFPRVYDALVNAGAIPNTYAEGIDYRTVYAFAMHGLIQCLEIADLWLHEYSRADKYDWETDTVTEYDGYYDAAKFGYSGVVLHDLS